MTDSGDSAGAANGSIGGGDGTTVQRDVLLRALLSFVAELRNAGVAVSADASITAARAIAGLDVYTKTTVRTALRATVVSRPGDLQEFDRVFEEFWPRMDAVEQTGAVENEGRTTISGRTPTADPSNTASDSELNATEQHARQRNSLVQMDTAAVETHDQSESGTLVYSRTGRSQAISVPTDTVDQKETFQESFRAFSAALAKRRGRRRTAHGSAQIDGRKLLRESLSTGGVPLRLPKQRRRPTELEAVLLVDVSRSVLETIDPGFLIQFLRLAHEEWRDVRTFLFDTEVREVTEQLDLETLHAAILALQQAELEWGGGTQIGEAIATVRSQMARDIDRNSIVIVVSDGLEVGDIDQLRDGMAWLARQSASILWLNPLAAREGYEATCEGMQAALPYIEAFYPFSGPDDVRHIATLLRQRSDGKQYS